MELIKTNFLTEDQKKEVYALWNNEYPKNLNHAQLEDFENYLNGLPKQTHLLLVDASGSIKGWYFDFARGNEKWFALILDSKIQGKGLGTILLKTAKDQEIELNGWVIDHNNDVKLNGNIYRSPLGFYIKNGFQVLVHSRLANSYVQGCSEGLRNVLERRQLSL